MDISTGGGPSAGTPSCLSRRETGTGPCLQVRTNEIAIAVTVRTLLVVAVDKVQSRSREVFYFTILDCFMLLSNENDVREEVSLRRPLVLFPFGRSVSSNFRE